MAQDAYDFDAELAALVGDLNGDGVVDARDAAMMPRGNPLRMGPRRNVADRVPLPPRQQPTGGTYGTGRGGVLDTLDLEERNPQPESAVGTMPNSLIDAYERMTTFPSSSQEAFQAYVPPLPMVANALTFVGEGLAGAQPVFPAAGPVGRGVANAGRLAKEYTRSRHLDDAVQQTNNLLLAAQRQGAKVSDLSDDVRTALKARPSFINEASHELSKMPWGEPPMHRYWSDLSSIPSDIAELMARQNDRVSYRVEDIGRQAQARGGENLVRQVADRPAAIPYFDDTAEVASRAAGQRYADDMAQRVMREANEATESARLADVQRGRAIATANRETDAWVDHAIGADVAQGATNPSSNVIGYVEALSSRIGVQPWQVVRAMRNNGYDLSSLSQAALRPQGPQGFSEMNDVARAVMEMIRKDEVLQRNTFGQSMYGLPTAAPRNVLLPRPDAP